MADESAIQQLFNLSGKTALVTGATGYLGSSLVRALAEAGANVIATSRAFAAAEAAAADLPAIGQARHFGIDLDHLGHDRLADGYSAAAALNGSIDILVNNGHEHCPSDLTNCTTDEFNRQLANATGYFLLARHVRDDAVACGQPASIIMLGSMYGLVGSYPDAYEGISTASPVAYHALKGGILQMTRHLAVYLGEGQPAGECPQSRHVPVAEGVWGVHRAALRQVADATDGPGRTNSKARLFSWPAMRAVM